MTSFRRHEVLVSLFQTRPPLAAEVLRLLGVAVPSGTRLRTDSADLTQITPTQYRADLVVVLERAERPVLGIVVEVQFKRDLAKRYSWPVYASTLRARLKCPVCVLVVAPTEAMARWCAKPVELGPSFTFAPFVLGPSAIPYITDEAEAKRAPELAVLSVLAHGREHQAKGREEGRAEGRVAALLAFLDARGLAVSPAEQETIAACNDDAVLTRWIRKAATAATVAEVFAEG